MLLAPGYDDIVLPPQGMLVKILEDSEQKEFVVCQGSEFARVGRKGIIFKVKFWCFFLDGTCDNFL